MTRTRNKNENENKNIKKLRRRFSCTKGTKRTSWKYISWIKLIYIIIDRKLRLIDIYFNWEFFVNLWIKKADLIVWRFQLILLTHAHTHTVNA